MVGIISTESLHNIISLRSPRCDPTVTFDAMDQLRSAVLQCQRISVILVQLFKHPHAI